MSEQQSPLCPKCGRTMERIFKTNSESPMQFCCPKCGHEQPRWGESWRVKDILFGIYAEFMKIRVHLAGINPDPSPKTNTPSAAPVAREATGTAPQTAFEIAQAQPVHHEVGARRHKRPLRAAKRKSQSGRH